MKNRAWSRAFRKFSSYNSFHHFCTTSLKIAFNPFVCNLNDFNDATPTAKAIFTNSDPSNAITLLVRDDQGKTDVDDVSVTNNDSYVIDTLKLNATYSVYLEKEGASDQDTSYATSPHLTKLDSLPLRTFRLTFTSNPFTYDANTPFLNKATVVFTNSDKSRSITLLVLDDKGVSVIKDIVVSPGSKPYITSLQLEKTYRLLLVKGTAQAEPR